MATALLQKLDDLTECSICCDAYKDPRQLPCLHSFCLKCLQGYARDKSLKSGMSCPLCRKETKLPCDGIQGFPRNFFMEKIMEIKRLSGPVTEGTKCDVCCEDEENSASSTDVPVAAMYCTNCHYNLCTRCTKDHSRHMKNHCIVELGCDKVTEQLAKTLATSFCSSHPQDTARMFCLDCKVVICFVCFAEEHQMHKCSDINKEAEIMRKQIESDIKAVSSCISTCQQSMTEMDEKKNNFLKQIETVETDICKRSNHLKEMIDRDTKALFTELESIKSSQLKDMCVKTEELDRSLTILNSFKTYGEEIVALGSACDVCHSYNQFHIRYDEIVGNFRDPPFEEFSPKRLTLQTTTVNEVQQKNLIGRIEDLSCKKEDDNDGDAGARKTASDTGARKTANDTVAWKTASDTGARKTANDAVAWKTANDTGARKTASDTGARKTARDTGAWKTASDTGAWKTANDTGGWKTTRDTGARKTASDTGAWKTANDSGAWKTASDTGGWKTANDTGSRKEASDTGAWKTASDTGAWKTANGTGAWEAWETASDTGGWKTARDTGARKTASDTGAWKTVSDTVAWKTASDTGAWKTASDTGAWKAANDTGAWKTASDIGAWKTASGTGGWKTANDTGAWKTASDIGAWKTANDTGAWKTANDSGAWKTASDTGDTRIAETEDENYNEEEFRDEYDNWHSKTHFTPSGRKKKSEMNLEDKSVKRVEKNVEKKCQKARKKKHIIL